MKMHTIKKEKTRSIRGQLNRYNMTALGVLLSVLVLYQAYNIVSVQLYNQAQDNYTNLSGFYKTLGNGNSHIRDYLYTQSQDSIDEYMVSMDEAYKNLANLKDSVHGEVWRITLLENMLDSYVEEASITREIFVKGEGDYSAQYTQLLHIFTLIRKTADTYYSILTDEMEILNIENIRMAKDMFIFTLLVSLAFIVWLFYFSKKTMQLITNPLAKIVNNINQIKVGQYDLSSISNSGIEMHELCNALDEMAVAVHNEIHMMKMNASLEKRLFETEKENLQKDEMLAQSEVKMLQNQINPHFLFNTLNMTYRLALQEGAPRSSEMIERTSALLRYGLDKQNKLSDLLSEAKATENYIVIQERRLSDRIRFELHIDEDIPAISIPGMIVQPLIENALKHGLKDCVEDGEVIVSFRYIDGFIYIIVSDNGEGMESEEVENMLLHNFHDEEGAHLGLYNVAKRLEIFFRDKVDISLHSAIGCGFEFIIKIEVDMYEKM